MCGSGWSLHGASDHSEEQRANWSNLSSTCEVCAHFWNKNTISAVIKWQESMHQYRPACSVLSVMEKHRKLWFSVEILEEGNPSCYRRSCWTGHLEYFTQKNWCSFSFEEWSAEVYFWGDELIWAFELELHFNNGWDLIDTRFKTRESSHPHWWNWWVCFSSTPSFHVTTH